MLLEINLHSKSLSNNSATSGFVWDIFNFEMCNDFEVGKYFWAVFTALCFAFGFPASVAILWELLQVYKKGTPFTPNDFFILNLSVMDFMFLFFIPFGILNHFTWQNWWFEAFWNGAYALNTSGRPLLMACVCLDCYLAVVHPITYRKKKSLTPRVVMAAIVWILTLATGIGYCMFFRLAYSMFPTVPYIIAVVVIVICDSLIVHTLIKSDPGRKNIHPQKQRAIQTLINSLVMTVLSYLPPVILLGIGNKNVNSSISSNFICTIGIPITITSSLGSAIMPLLHLKNHGKLGCFMRPCCRKF